MYASRSTNPLEKKNYHTHELEALAMVWATEVFRHYLYGKKFLIYTDNRALKWLMSRDHSTRVTRWVMRLQELDFDVVHRAGTANGNADGLSRNPLESTQSYGEEGVEPLYTCDVEKKRFPKPRLSQPEGTLWCKNTKGSTVMSLAALTRAQRLVEQDDSKNEAEIPPREDDEVESEEIAPPGEEVAADPEILASYFGSSDRDAWTLEKIKEYQAEDDNVKKYMTEIRDAEAENSTTTTRFRLQDGLVVLKVKKESIHARDQDRVVVPDTLKAFVLHLHHNMLLTGHQGRERTTAVMKQRFWWKGMNTHCRRWIKSCVPCRRRKTPRPMRSGLTQPMFKGHPMHTIAIDFVGPCPETENGDVWILTMIDVFTRWSIAIPLPNRKATTVQKALYEHLFTQHGFPVRILSDRGKEFIDAGLIKLCRWLGIAKIQTTGYQPQANGHIERLHRYMNAAMTTLCRKNVSLWDRYLSNPQLCSHTELACVSRRASRPST
jgi:transposase InsO family protein